MSFQLGIRSLIVIILFFLLPYVLKLITNPFYDNWTKNDPDCNTGMIGLACIGLWMMGIYLLNTAVFIFGCLSIRNFIKKSSKQNSFIIILSGYISLLFAVILSQSLQLPSSLFFALIFFPTAVVGTFLLLEKLVASR